MFDITILKKARLKCNIQTLKSKIKFTTKFKLLTKQCFLKKQVSNLQRNLNVWQGLTQQG